MVMTPACGPAVATRSPAFSSCTPRPHSSTIPALEYPSGMGSSSFARTCSSVAMTPSFFIFWRTR